MKKKLSIRAAISLLLSMILFCMPVGHFWQTVEMQWIYRHRRNRKKVIQKKAP